MKTNRKHLALRPMGLAVMGVALASVAAACGGSSSGGSTASVGTGGGSSTPAASVTVVHSGPNGKYVTDSAGRTLYIFSKDTSSTSMCTGACTKEWPAYSQNGQQVVFHGHPVYYFEGDSSAGDMGGQGLDDFGGLWTMVQPNGSAVAASASGSSPSPSGGSSSEWG